MASKGELKTLTVSLEPSQFIYIIENSIKLRKIKGMSSHHPRNLFIVQLQVVRDWFANSKK